MLKQWFPYFVGKRYFTTHKGSRFLSVITVISVSGVAVGVFAMVVVLSVMSGFEHEMKTRMFRSEAHIKIEKEALACDFDCMQKIKAADSHVAGVNQVLQTEVVLKAGKRVSGAILKGMDGPFLEKMRKSIEEWMPLRTDGPQGMSVFMGQELAYELGVSVGDVVTAVSPNEIGGPMGAAPRIRNIIVEGIYKTGVPEQELHEVYLKLRDVESFLRRADTLSSIEVTVSDYDSIESTQKNIAAALGSDYQVRSWQELNAHLFSALRLERIAMFVMLAFIIIVAGFNILSVLTMTVIEKKRSLSILRALGATSKSIEAIVLCHSFLIAGLGVILGGSLGFATCLFLKKFPIIELPEFYYDRTLPVRFDSATITVVMSLVLVVVYLGALIPARRAAKLSPLHGIHQK